MVSRNNITCTTDFFSDLCFTDRASTCSELVLDMPSATIKRRTALDDICRSKGIAVFAALVRSAHTEKEQEDIAAAAMRHCFDEAFQRHWQIFDGYNKELLYICAHVHKRPSIIAHIGNVYKPPVLTKIKAFAQSGNTRKLALPKYSAIRSISDKKEVTNAAIKGGCVDAIRFLSSRCLITIDISFLVGFYGHAHLVPYMESINKISWERMLEGNGGNDINFAEMIFSTRPHLKTSRAALNSIVISTERGRIDYVRYMLGDALVRDKLRDKSDTGFCYNITRAAAVGNQTSIIDYLEKNCLLQADGLLCGASEGGHIDLVKKSVALGSKCFDHAINAACTTKQIGVIAYLICMASSWDRVIMQEAITQAIEDDQLDNEDLARIQTFMCAERPAPSSLAEKLEGIRRLQVFESAKSSV